MWSLLILGYHSLPVLFYLLASLNFYRLAHLPMTYWRWTGAYAGMTVTAVLLSLTRLFNLADVLLDHSATDVWLVPWQTALVILASVSLWLASRWQWLVFREGGMPKNWR